MVSLTNDCSVSHWVDKWTVKAKRASFESSGVLGFDIRPSTRFIFFFSRIKYYRYNKLRQFPLSPSPRDYLAAAN